jgi:hypothetical protein
MKPIIDFTTSVAPGAIINIDADIFGLCSQALPWDRFCDLVRVFAKRSGHIYATDDIASLLNEVVNESKV